MSVYLMSDLHGDFFRFKKMLSKIKFDCDKDKIYILGDVLDRGNENLSLLSFIRENIKAGCMVLLKGNHELFAQMYMDGLLDAKTWISWGGEQTLKEIERLGVDERKELREFLASLEYFKTLQENGNKWLLTHSGLDADYIIETENKVNVIESIIVAVENNEFKYLISNDIHYLPFSKLQKMDCFVVVGHTPVMGLNEDGSCLILHKEKYMCIDSGSGYRKSGGKMSCYRIDDKKEFYV